MLERKTIQRIWFEFSAAQDPVDRFDSNSDVMFDLSDGSRWEATFFTYQNIETLRKKNQSTGECLNGVYFCASSMILISEMTEDTIKAVLEELLLSGELEAFCHRLRGNEAT